MFQNGIKQNTELFLMQRNLFLFVLVIITAVPDKNIQNVKLILKMANEANEKSMQNPNTQNINKSELLSQLNTGSTLVNAALTSEIYDEKILKIRTDANLFKTLYNNVDSLAASVNCDKIGMIGTITAYHDQKTNKITDFWGKLEFNKNNNELVDTTKCFKGILKNDWADLILNSRMGMTGFFIEKNQSEQDDWDSVFKAKKLVTEIANAKRITVHELMLYNKPLSLIEEIVFASDFPFHPEDIINVCICRNNNCKTACTEVGRVRRKSLL